ncbi:hypothetical protein RB195_012112 [Necator americanus]|uniref:WDR19 first beta-propeller domain-containing protein n=1 Tax=Necator americanus TaxID=51031 RepID=A0ABR1D6I8_NECAM
MASANKSVILYDKKGAIVDVLDVTGELPLCLVWSSVSSLLVIGNNNGNLFIYNHQLSRKIPVLGKHQRKVTGVVMTKQDKILCCSDDSTITVSSSDGETIKTLSLANEPVGEIKRPGGNVDVILLLGRSTRILWSANLGPGWLTLTLTEEMFRYLLLAVLFQNLFLWTSGKDNDDEDEPQITVSFNSLEAHPDLRRAFINFLLLSAKGVYHIRDAFVVCNEKEVNMNICLNDSCPEITSDMPVEDEEEDPPRLTHDILVSRTSVRPKACNQVTGRCKGGGLESPPTNKLHMSAPGEPKFSQILMGLEACNLPMGFKFYAKHSNRKESPDSGGKLGTVAPGRMGLQESYRLPKRKTTTMAICTSNVRTLASEAAIEDMMMQAKKIK